MVKVQRDGRYIVDYHLDHDAPYAPYYWGIIHFHPTLSPVWLDSDQTEFWLIRVC